MRLLLLSLADGVLSLITSLLFTTLCSAVILATAVLAVFDDFRWIECTFAVIAVFAASVFLPWAIGYNGITITTGHDRAELRRRSSRPKPD